MRKRLGIVSVLLAVLTISSLTGCGGVAVINKASEVDDKTQYQNTGVAPAEETKPGSNSVDSDTKSNDPNVDDTGVTTQSQSSDYSDQITTLPMTDEQKPVVD